MHTFQTFCRFAALGFALIAGAKEVAADERPNIIICMTDDQGWGDIGYHNPDIRTPNLDAMSRAGIRFDRFYAAAPMCSPTRATCLTGRTNNRYFCYDWGHDLPLREMTFAEMLKQQGYATGHFGKWHLGGLPIRKEGYGRMEICGEDPAQRHPGNQGFDYWVSSGNWFKNGFSAGTLFRNGEDMGEVEGDTSDIVMDEAIQFIRTQVAQEKPVLAVIWFPSPHIDNKSQAWKAAPTDRALFEKHGDLLANYYGEIHGIDRAMGRLREELKSLGIRDNTMLWFHSDNGEYWLANHHKKARTAGVDRFSGAKGDLREGGLLVPGIIEWPARIASPIITDVPVSTLDIYPTVLEAAGVKQAEQPQPIDGMSIVPLIDGSMTRRPKPIPFAFWPNGDRNQFRNEVGFEAAWVDNEYKLVRQNSAAGGRDLLFDLSLDPRETTDLSAREPEVYQRMGRQLTAWQTSLEKSRLEYPVVARPNVVVFLSDDQGWGDLSLHGNTQLSTPNIDRLAREGAQFDRFYVSPVCSPTRAEFLTGRHHVRTGVYSTSQGGERLNAGETTIADLFKVDGYRTAAFGKWHNGMQFPYHPNARGFDEFYGFCSGHWGNYFDPMLEHNGRIVQGLGYLPDDLTTKALDFIETHRDEPFFVYLPYNTPHSPMQVPDPWWDRVKDKPLDQPNRYREKENQDFTRAALAMCENIDWNVGRVMKKLDELELDENTIVVYFSDNGPNSYRWNGDMRGKKGHTDEGGVRSPLFVRWPGKIAAGTDVLQISSAMDLLPTLADLAGVPVQGTNPLDGINLGPLLLGETESVPPRTLINSWRSGKVSVRTQQYRLDHENNLYDMVADPGQRVDVSKQHPDVAARLTGLSCDWKTNAMCRFGEAFDERPFVIGHPDSPYTQLPARDAKPLGNIKRSNRWPNSSYFTNWTDLDDSITWKCEVGQSGDYLVELFYTCPEADVGSVVELSFNGAALTGKISEAHESPLVGMEYDRVPRDESYEKNFKRMTLGTIHLGQGVGTLKLRALEIPGAQVMDFRLLYLTRIK